MYPHVLPPRGQNYTYQTILEALDQMLAIRSP